MVHKLLKNLKDQVTWNAAKAAAMISGKTLPEWLMEAAKEKLERDKNNV